MRRSKLETLFDILTVLVLYGPQKITMLMRKADLNFIDAMKFLGFTMQKMFVDKQGSLYLITPQGRTFYKHLKPWGNLEKHLRNQAR